MPDEDPNNKLFDPADKEPKEEEKKDASEKKPEAVIEPAQSDWCKAHDVQIRFFKAASRDRAGNTSPSVSAAATWKGVSTVGVGDTPEEAVRQLQNRHRALTSRMHDLRTQILGMLNSGSTPDDMSAFLSWARDELRTMYSRDGYGRYRMGNEEG